jgi:outer membrane lipoprotein-sorting protein
MKKIFLFLFSILTVQLSAQPSGKEILDRIDKNMSSKSRIFDAKMIISGVRGSRTIEFKSWGEGETRSYTEYMSPAREKGSKMLKLEDKLWIFSPSTDRIIQITGQMLRQSVMGSDLSYEDLMEDPEMEKHYSASVAAADTAGNRKCWILQLNAIKEGEAYEVRKIWVDQERMIPLKEELYGKSGKLLKRTTLSDVQRIGDRWYPMTIIFKDMLKSGDGTKLVIASVKLDAPIPEDTFSKASLK